MSATAVVTDSTCDIPDWLVDKHQISVLPLYINFSDRSYRDGVDLSRSEFYRLLRTAEEVPTTASPGPSPFREVYERLGEQGFDEVISIHISPSLSSAYEMAVMGARETTGVNVTLFSFTIQDV
jgi:DegV family protein with EDD domain